MSQDVDALRSGILGRDPGDNAERETEKERREGERDRDSRKCQGVFFAMRPTFQIATCVSPQGKITDIYYTFTYCMGVRGCMSIYVKYIIFIYISDKKTADFVVRIHLE